MAILKFYKLPGLKSAQLKTKLSDIRKVSNIVSDLKTELCYYIEIKEELNEKEIQLLRWLLVSPIETNTLKNVSVFDQNNSTITVIEIGPR